MNKTIEFSINKKNNGERLDVFLSKEIKNLTRSYIKKLIEKNNVRLNKSIKTSPSTRIKTNDKIIINIIIFTNNIFTKPSSRCTIIKTIYKYIHTSINRIKFSIFYKT